MEISVLEKLELAYDFVEEVWQKTPELDRCQLDMALAILILAISRARHSTKLRPRQIYKDGELPF